MKVVRFRRGQIWFYKDNNSYNGSIQGKSRPVIIVSNDLANRYSTCLLAIPITTAEKKDMPTHTYFDLNGNRCTALAENLLSINSANLTNYEGTLDDELMIKIDNNLRIALGLLEQSTISDTTNEFTDVDLTTITDKSEVKRCKYKSLTEKQAFIDDYINFGIDYVKEKYNEVSDSAVYNKIYRFKRKLEKVKK